jgi:hypothetical protein
MGTDVLSFKESPKCFENVPLCPISG